MTSISPTTRFYVPHVTTRAKCSLSHALLNFALGLSNVKYIQLMKLVQQKIQIPSLANLTERKFKNRESKHDDAMLNLLTQDSLGTS